MKPHITFEGIIIVMEDFLLFTQIRHVKSHQ